jgi:hypothetical protein
MLRSQAQLRSSSACNLCMIMLAYDFAATKPHAHVIATLSLRQYFRFCPLYRPPLRNLRIAYQENG